MDNDVVSFGTKSPERAAAARTMRRYPARIARQLALALAHALQHRVHTGEFADYADVARHQGITRARLTQVMNLLLLAADIQAQVLVLRFPPGREPVTERHLRQVRSGPSNGRCGGPSDSLPPQP